MKKNGQRAAIIGTAIYNIEITRVFRQTSFFFSSFFVIFKVKRDKERSSSVNNQNEEAQPTVETKRSAAEEHDTPEKSRLLQRIIKEGGQQMFMQQNPASAFGAPYQMQPSDDDSISVDFQHNNMQTRTVTSSFPIEFRLILLFQRFQHQFHRFNLFKQVISIPCTLKHYNNSKICIHLIHNNKDSFHKHNNHSFHKDNNCITMPIDQVNLSLTSISKIRSFLLFRIKIHQWVIHNNKCQCIHRIRNIQEHQQMVCIFIDLLK